MKVSDYPLIKTLILLLVGFLLAHQLSIDRKIIVLLICFFFFLTILLIYFNSRYKSPTVSLVVIFTGYLIFSSSYYENTKEIKLLDALNYEKVLLYGYVKKIDYFGQDKIQFVLKSDKLVVNGEWVSVNQNILVNLNLKENFFPLRYFEKIISSGNQIRISGNISKPAEPQFIGDFNSKYYLKSRDINYILNSNLYDDLSLIEEDRSILNFSRHLNTLRQKLKAQIENNFDKLTAAYIKGLFIAERSDISDDIKENFINSGVIHVLAVSGLHTGYIALILMALTGRLNKWLRLLLVFVGLFVFAHLANLSPSVVRASIMSITVLINYAFERKILLLNSICLSAFLILIFNPLDIFNPGFQLSFAAVLSIALIYPVLLNKLGASKIYGWKKKIIDMILISLAVTIGAFPLVVSYYQKFSFISLLANLIVIPLTGIILGGIILNLVVMNFFSFASLIYKIALTELINLNFKVVEFFASIPFAYTNISNFSTNHSFIYYLIVVFIILILNSEYKPVLKFLFIILFIFNFIFHFNSLSDLNINPDSHRLILVKLHNSNSLFNGNKDYNFFKFYGKNDSLKLIAKDLDKIDKICRNLNIEKIKTASISSPAILLKNGFKLRLNHQNIFNMDDQIWIYSDSIFKSNDLYRLLNKIDEFIFVRNSFTELYRLNDWIMIISPISFNSVAEKLPFQKLKFIYTKPEFDTLWMKTPLSRLQVIPINIDKIGMKIFELKSNGINEIKWR